MLTVNKKHHGFSMIEVLVSLVVIGVGMLGLSGLQIASMKGTNNAHSRNVATNLAMELSERMRANPNAISIAGDPVGFYENDVNCKTNEEQCRGTNFCSPEKIARLDIQEVMCGVLRAEKREGGAANLLPNGNLIIDYGADCDPNISSIDETNVTISWNEMRVHEDQAESSEDNLMSICVIP